MAQRILGLLAGGTTVAAVAALAVLWLGGKETDTPSVPGKSDEAVSVVIEQQPLSREQAPMQPSEAALSQAGDDDPYLPPEYDQQDPEDDAEITNRETPPLDDPGTPTTQVAPSQVDANSAPIVTPELGASSGASDVQTRQTPQTPGATEQPSVASGSSAEASLPVLGQSDGGVSVPLEPASPAQIAEVAATLQDDASQPNDAEDTDTANGGTQEQQASESDPGPEAEPLIAETQPPQPEDPSDEQQELALANPREPAVPQTSDQSSGTQEQTETRRTGPEFDVVRVDRDGQTVIAGRADPDELVEVLIDGQIVGEARADASGQFVAVVFANLSDSAQKLELRSSVAPSVGIDKDLEVTRGATETDDAKGTRDPGQPSEEVSDDAPTIASQVQDLTVPTALEDAASGAAFSTNGSSAVQRRMGTSGLDASANLTVGTSSGPVASEVPATGQRYAVSNPVLILPSDSPDAAPTLVQPQQDELAVLQPVARDIVGVVLDSISYNDAGDVVLAGRGVAGRMIRIYANGRARGIVGVATDGSWRWATTMDDPTTIKLFRMDEIGVQGQVTSRVETPFEYSRLSPQVVRDRRVVIQKGDMLWRIAEQFYGEGIRYSSIYGANTELIRDPDLIYPGQVFTIPELVDAN